MIDCKIPFSLSTETVEKLCPIVVGAARERNNGDPGCIKFVFNSPRKETEVKFVSISSVVFFDEIFAGKDTYPYPYLVKDKAGLYECIGSSYLEKIKNNDFTGEAFSKNRHFVYFDLSYCWHITAEGFSVSQHILQS